MDLRTLAAGFGALSDDTRRALYEYVVGERGPVSREQAATALGIRQHKVNFHLDRLAEEGLLDVEHKRLTGRSGPGAGRPSKLYRRSGREYSLSLPPRRYDLVGDILATSVSRAEGGQPLDEALSEAAREHGLHDGAQVGGERRDGIDDLVDVLAGQGFEPVDQQGVVELHNCPFDSLARKHTALVCGLNASYIQGLAEGMSCSEASARLEPGDGRCCVRVHSTA